MHKIKLTETQIAMLQQFEKTSTRKTILKINEDQYGRMFKGMDNANKSMDKSIKMAQPMTTSASINGISEAKDEDIDPLRFAQELIVFIKDIITKPESVPFSDYWNGLGISRKELFAIIKKEGLVDLMVDETSGTNTYKSKINGFRKKIKEVYKQLCADKQPMVEDGGYPEGAENDPTAPWNQPDGEPSSEVRKANKEILTPIYYNSKNDGLMLFKRGNTIYVFMANDVDADAFADYQDIDNIIDDEAVSNYVNDKLETKEVKVYNDIEQLKLGQVVIVNPDVKQELMNYFGDDIKMIDILNQIPESTGAASSGAYVGGMSGGPIKKDTGIYPEDAMNDLNEKSGSDPCWDGYEMVGMKDKNGKQVPNCVKKGGSVAEAEIEETTTTTSAGGDSGTFAYDAPAGDGSEFWNAGNKQNKKGDMPLVKRGIGVNESFHSPDGTPIGVNSRHEPITSNIQVGQIYINGSGRAKIEKIIDNDTITIRRWGDVKANSVNVNPNQLRAWTLLEGTKKVLKITEAQMKRIVESYGKNKKG
jgi:hypothetical protein